MYRVGIVCNNGNWFLNSKRFPTIRSAFVFMWTSQRYLNEHMAIEDENGKTILRKGIQILPQKAVKINQI